MDQAAERAGLVERALAAGSRLKQHLSAFCKEANAGIKEEWPQDVGQLQTHLVELRAAVTSGTDCAAALDATAGVVDKVGALVLDRCDFIICTSCTFLPYNSLVLISHPAILDSITGLDIFGIGGALQAALRHCKRRPF